MKLRITIAVCLAFVFSVPAHALIQYDFEQALFSDAPQPVLDHCVVEQDGVYHLFYLRGNPAVNIGHATTTDFIHWNTLTPVLSPGSWDNLLWAPYITRNNGAWFMYYTGVNSSAAQQTGLAFSGNLMNWYKYNAPIYHPDPSWAVWDSNTFCHGRDPHVMEIDGTYYLFVTAQHQWYKGAVACATSSDLITWTDAGFIYLHNSWHMLESVFILQRNGLFHMFFTEEAVYGTSQMSSPTLFGGWDITQRRYIDNGHAPQITETPGGEIFSRHSVYNDNHGTNRYCLRFSPMVWTGDLPSVPRPYALQPDWNFVVGDAFYYQPTFSNNAAVRNETYPSSFVGDGWINTKELYTGPVGYGQPGLAQGDDKTGIIRSNPFSIQGNSMSLLVGGADAPGECYVRLVDNDTQEVLLSETGKNSDVMDERLWDISPYMGRSVYMEIADLSTTGHVCADEIRELGNPLAGATDPASGTGKKVRDGSSGLVAAAPVSPARLVGNVPNPFNPLTQIRFELPAAARARIDVYDAAGSLVRTLVDEQRGPGSHAVEWDGTNSSGQNVASGVYFARLRTDGALVDTHKLMLIK